MVLHDFSSRSSSNQTISGHKSDVEKIESLTRNVFSQFTAVFIQSGQITDCALNQRTEIACTYTV